MTTSTFTTIDLTDTTHAADVPASSVVVLVYRGTKSGQTLDTADFEQAVAHPLMAAFSAVQHHWPAITEARHRGRVVVLAPATAALGDPLRPLDCAVAGALISFVRSVAIELQRHGGAANAVFYETDPKEPAVSELISAVTAEHAAAVTGQEIYATNGTDLGRLHP
jgi:NAD(P)-dependent dehydrogenase (short-subunit alcohol dehydrogenase family)